MTYEPVSNEFSLTSKQESDLLGRTTDGVSIRYTIRPVKGGLRVATLLISSLVAIAFGYLCGVIAEWLGYSWIIGAALGIVVAEILYQTTAARKLQAVTFVINPLSQQIIFGDQSIPLAGIATVVAHDDSDGTTVALAMQDGSLLPFMRTVNDFQRRRFHAIAEALWTEIQAQRRTNQPAPPAQPMPPRSTLPAAQDRWNSTPQERGSLDEREAAWRRQWRTPPQPPTR